MPEPRWWVHRPGAAAGEAPLGPLSSTEVVDLAGIDLETWICPEGGSEWIPLGEIGPLRDRLRARFAPANVAAAVEKAPIGSGLSRIPAPIRLTVLVVVVFFVLGQGLHFFLFRPLNDNVQRMSQAKNDETQLQVFANDYLGEGELPECPTPRPISEIPRFAWVAKEKMDRTPWGEPWLYQCKAGRFRILSPRGEGIYRAVDSNFNQVVTVKDLAAPWPESE